MENYLLEAFQKLSLLEDDFNFSADRDVVDELKSFVADDVEEIPEEPVIDITAESEQDLADNYVGKVILECECCHTRIYKEEAEVVVDEEQGLANVDEACPVCGNTMGYTVIGKIEKFDEEPLETEEEEEIELENDPADEEPIESLREKLKKRRALGESKCEEKCEGEECEEDMNALRRKFGGKSAKKEGLEEDIEKSKGVNMHYGWHKTEPARDGSWGLADKDGNVTTHYGLSGANAYVAALFVNDINGIANDLPEVKQVWGTTDGDRSIFYVNDGVIPSRELAQKIVDRYAQDGVELKVTSIDKTHPGNNGVWAKVVDLPEDAFKDNLYPEYEVKPRRIRKNKEAVADESLKEGIENLSMDTDDTHVEMTSTEDGGATVTVTPKDNMSSDLGEFDDTELPLDDGDEEIVPLSDEEQEDILANEPEGAEDEFDFDEFEDEFEEEPIEGEEGEEETEEEEIPEESLKGSNKSSINEEVEDDIDIDEFDEATFDDLAESYLRKVYENVNTFETTSIKDSGEQLVVEGVIKFKNNKTKASKFVFTEANETKTGKVILEGYNETFSKEPKSFKVKGSLKNNNYVAEAMNYKYTVRNLNEGKVERTKVQGKVRVNK